MQRPRTEIPILRQTTHWRLETHNWKFYGTVHLYLVNGPYDIDFVTPSKIKNNIQVTSREFETVYIFVYVLC